MNVISRSANADINAFEVSGDGGTGLDNGNTIVISQLPRTPRVAR